MEKSTAAGPATERIHPDVLLDSRLAIFHETEKWLAAADVHYGYEVSRRAEGALWPMWGMGTIEERFASLLDDYEPDTVIFAGDVVDGGLASREAITWIESVRERCEEVVLIAGNHDRGSIRKKLEFVESLEAEGGFLFHHGHQPIEKLEGEGIEITGHWHPSVTLHDGAGLTLRLPSLVQEKESGGWERWVLPAFSPWAGGVKWRVRSDVEVLEWVCGRNRILKWSDSGKS